MTTMNLCTTLMKCLMTIILCTKIITMTMKEVGQNLKHPKLKLSLRLSFMQRNNLWRPLLGLRIPNVTT